MYVASCYCGAFVVDIVISAISFFINSLSDLLLLFLLLYYCLILPPVPDPAPQSTPALAAAPAVGM